MNEKNRAILLLVKTKSSNVKPKTKKAFGTTVPNDDGRNEWVRFKTECVLLTQNKTKKGERRKQMTETETLNCVDCGEEYPVGRYLALVGDAKRRVRCVDCAELLPPPVRTVANLHKSNAILITDRRDLIGINQKGGLVK